MNYTKKLLKLILFLIAIPLIYIAIALIITVFTVDKLDTQLVTNKTIYLNTNGVHLDLILQKKDIDNKLLSGLRYRNSTKYIAFGWGEENFYLNTPTWRDLTLSNAFKALFLKNTTVMHLVHYKHKHKDWVAIKVTENELQKLNTYINNSFYVDNNNVKQLIETKGYSNKDNFYKANGQYSFIKTCNTWVNNIFRASGLKACYWTPFDFGLLNKYK